MDPVHSEKLFLRVSPQKASDSTRRDFSRRKKLFPGKDISGLIRKQQRQVLIKNSRTSINLKCIGVEFEVGLGKKLKMTDSDFSEIRYGFNSRYVVFLLTI